MTDLLALSEAIIDGARSIDDHHPVAFAAGATLQELAPDLAFVESFSNSIVYRDDEGLAMVDAGSPLHAPAIVQRVRDWTALPLRTAVFTHGHVDHIYEVPLLERAQSDPCHVIAHERTPERFRRYERTNGYNAAINQRQFQLAAPLFPGDYRYPDEVYRDTLGIRASGLDLVLHHARGETDDGTWLWDPAHRAVLTGDLFIWASPNCGNPQKAQRYCDEWAVALRRMAALRPELLLPGHGLPIAGAERVQRVLTETARYLESIFDQTIDAMNTGATLDEILHSVRPPADLDDAPWLQPVYDEPEFVVRGIWRLYGGWYDGNPAHLKPAPDDAVAAEVASLAGGADRLARRALELSSAGDHRLAGHLIEFAGRAAPADEEIRRARATVFAERARQERSTMSKGVFSWAARSASPGPKG